MHKSRIKKNTLVIMMLMLLFSLTACKEKKTEEVVEKEVVRVMPGAYDSLDKAIVVATHENEQLMTFYNLNKNRHYTLKYDGATFFFDKYGSAISAAQVNEGELVEIQFLKGKKLLARLQNSAQIWNITDKGQFRLDINAGTLTIKDEEYTIDQDTLVFSDNRLADFSAINPQDTIEIRGIDHQIYSINIDKGHGYLRLANAQNFYGGWIEVGQKTIHKIEKDVILTVPEGKHPVYVSHIGIEGEKEVIITRGQETTLDLGDIKKLDNIEYGQITFSVYPKEASVYFDGKQIDISRIIKTEYGLHQVQVEAEGYDSVTQYIRISQDKTNLAISLDKTKEKTISENALYIPKVSDNAANNGSNNSNSTNNKTNNSNTNNSNNTSNNTNNNSSTSSTNTNTTTEKKEEKIYKVTIYTPEYSELYVDGNYVGIIPVSFTKVPGKHNILIKADGYVSRNYTIELDDTKEDVTYYFNDLTPDGWE